MVLDNQQILRITAARGLPKWVQQCTALRLGEGVAGKVAVAGLPLLVESRRAGTNPNLAAGSYRSDTFLSVPVPGEQRILGVVNVTEPVDESPFQGHDLEQLVQIAQSIGLTMQQALRYRELEQQALRDELTGLYNRRYLHQFLDTIIDQAQREGFSVTLLLFDIDHFKRYNDEFGHPAGDEVLKEVAQLMSDNFRARDVVCRMGGEEFAVVLWDGRGDSSGSAWQAYPTTAFEFAERLRHATLHHRFQSINHVGITLSGGLASYPWDGGSVPELIRQADEALYRAKRDGRNRVYLCAARGADM
jgi:diguanylate cyclase (GGDEF)-like protein